MTRALINMEVSLGKGDGQGQVILGRWKSADRVVIII